MKAKILTPLNKQPRFNYGVMDIETKSDMKTVLCAGWYDGKEYTFFRNVDQFLKFFMSRDFAGWRCFAHNGAGFDHQFILESLRAMPKFNYRIFSNCGAANITVERHGQKWIFLDSLKLMPASLKELTKSFGVTQKLDVDRMNMEALSREELEEYNYIECKGLYEVIKKFESWFNGLGVPLMPTIASQAMVTYRRMMKFSIPCLHESTENFVRRGYYGGRVEVFKMKCFDKIRCYDFTSLYPHVMKKYPMPVGTPHQTFRWVENAIGFYDATITIPHMYVPPVPIIMKHKLIFPVGVVRGVYSSIELDYCMKKGCDVEIHSGYVFNADFIFREYVDKFYKLKQESDGATKMIAKLLLNSLYGKFAQSRRKEIIVRTNKLDEILGCMPYDEELGLWAKPSVSRANFIIPSIAAWVTACARMELIEAIEAVGDENIFYCDTDSVYTTKKMKDGNNLGDLKLEVEGEQAIFLMPKLYALKKEDGVIVKAKGFEREFVRKLDMQAFENALHGDYRDFIQCVRRFGKFKESLKRTGNFVAVLEKKKSIQNKYSKRIVLPDYDTAPLNVRHIVTPEIS